MAQVQTPDAVRSNAGKKAAATRAAKAAAAKAGTVVGPKGAPLEQPVEAPEVTDEQRQGERRQAQNNAIAQFAQSQMTTPAAHEAPSEDEVKARAFQEAVQAMATSMGIDPAVVLAPVAQAKPVKAPRAEKQVQNNVTRPATGTKTGEIWDIADSISASQGGNPATIAQLRERKELKQTNENTLKTQYARWRSYHGIKGRTAAPTQAAQAQSQPIPEGYDDGLKVHTPARRKNDPKPE